VKHSFRVIVIVETGGDSFDQHWEQNLEEVSREEMAKRLAAALDNSSAGEALSEAVRGCVTFGFAEGRDGQS
jgi:hypothetical protein